MVDGTIRENEKLHSLLANIPGIIFRSRCEENWRIEFLSDNVFEVLGFAPEDFLGERKIKFAHLVHAADYPNLLAAAELASAELGSYTVEYRVFRRDGSMLWVSESGKVSRESGSGALILDGAIFDITKRKEAEYALQQSETRFRDVAETIGGYVWEVDEGGRLLYIADRVRDVLGYEPGELLGKPFQNLVDPEDLVLVAKNFKKKFVHENRFMNLEHRMVHKNGERIWIQASGVRIFNLDEEPCGWRGVTQDITERKRSEIELRKLALVAQQTQYAVSIADRSGVLTWVNDGWTKVTGYTYEESVGRKPTDLIRGPQTDNSVASQISQAIADERQIGCEILNYNKSGEPYWVWTSITPLRDDSGEVISFIAIEYDVTERKAERERLAVSESRLAEAQRVANIGSSIYDVESGKSDWTDQTFIIYGLKPSQKAPNNEQYAKLIHPEDFPGLNVQIDAAIRSGSPFERDVRLRPHGSQIRYVHIKAEPIKDGSGKVVKIVSTVHDVTDRRQVVRELIEAREAAMEASNMKSQFLANVSHEIRTPMNGVIGMSELLLASELSDEQRDFAATILDSAASLMSIIDGILDFSQIEAGKMSLHVAEIDLVQTLEECAGLFAKKAMDKSLKLRVEVHHEFPTARYGDVTRIRQIVSNLVHNALKFTNKGEVVIRAEQKEGARSDHWIRISVRDTGIGIPKARHAAVFDSFTQADGSTTRRYGGTGLGLAIVRQLAQLMGGNVGLESREGAGSTFWVDLPLAIQDAPSVVQPAKPASAVDPVGEATLAALGLRVLLVEDNAINRKVASRIFERMGCQVEIAEDGRQAVKACSARAFDLVFMDLQMPILDGFEATALIRQLEKGARFRTPIIALTAHAMPEDHDKCLAIGMDDYISKPIRKGELLRVLDQWAGTCKAAAA